MCDKAVLVQNRILGNILNGCIKFDKNRIWIPYFTNKQHSPESIEVHQASSHSGESHPTPSPPFPP